MKTSTRVAAALATTALTVGAVGAVGVVTAGPATADVDRQGSCGGARFELDVDRDDDRRGTYEVSADLDNAAGPRYRVILKQNGATYYQQVRRADREGDIEVERNRRDTPGADTFVLRYRNLASGKLCRTSITVR